MVGPPFLARRHLAWLLLVVPLFLVRLHLVRPLFLVRKFLVRPLFLVCPGV